MIVIDHEQLRLFLLGFLLWVFFPPNFFFLLWDHSTLLCWLDRGGLIQSCTRIRFLLQPIIRILSLP